MAIPIQMDLLNVCNKKNCQCQWIINVQCAYNWRIEDVKLSINTKLIKWTRKSIGCFYWIYLVLARRCLAFAEICNVMCLFKSLTNW